MLGNVPLLERFILPKELLTPIVIEENLCKDIIETEENSRINENVKDDQTTGIRLFRKKY